MLNSKKSRKGAIGAAVLAGVLAISGYALTDLITVPATSHAGDGVRSVVPMTVTNVHYDLNGAVDPDQVNSIRFDLNTGGSALSADSEVWVLPAASDASTEVGTEFDNEAGPDYTDVTTDGSWYLCDVTTYQGVTDPTGVMCYTTTDGTNAGTPTLNASHVTDVRVVVAD